MLSIIGNKKFNIFLSIQNCPLCLVFVAMLCLCEFVIFFYLHDKTNKLIDKLKDTFSEDNEFAMIATKIIGSNMCLCCL